MVVIKDGKKYYTSDEVKKYLHQKAVEDAKVFAREVMRRKYERM